MDYLKNDICKFTPLFNIDYNVKKDIITTCLFKMENGYRDLSVYVNGLIRLYNYIQKKHKTFHLRVFVDKSIHDDKNIMNKILNLNKIELVLYSCPNFMINHNYHFGLFGTIIRFFPFFNFPNNDAKNVIISDIDSYTRLDELIELLNSQNKYLNDIHLIKRSRITKNFYIKNDIYYKDIINVYGIAVNFIGIKRINNEIIINFVNDVLNNKYNSLSMYKDASDDKKKEMKNFIYGVDEYFLNKILMNHIIDNKIPFANNIFYNISDGLYYSIFKENINSLFESDDKKKIINSLVNKILNKIKIKYNDSDELKDKYMKIDELIYKKHNNYAIKIFKLLYIIFLCAYKKDKYKFIFSSELYNILLQKKYFGVYEMDKIIYEFTKINDKNNKIYKFNKDDMNDLYKYVNDKNIKLID